MTKLENDNTPSHAPQPGKDAFELRSLGAPSIDKALLANFAASTPDPRLPLLTASQVTEMFDRISEDVGAAATLDRDLWEKIYLKAGAERARLGRDPAEDARRPEGDKAEDYAKLFATLRAKVFGPDADFGLHVTEGTGVDEYWKAAGAVGEMRLIGRFLGVDDPTAPPGAVIPLASPSQIATVLRNHFADPEGSPVTPGLMDQIRRFSENRAFELDIPGQGKPPGVVSEASDFRDLAEYISRNLADYERRHSEP